jgi:hypothetical protein
MEVCGETGGRKTACIYFFVLLCAMCKHKIRFENSLLNRRATAIIAQSPAMRQTRRPSYSFLIPDTAFRLWFPPFS